MSSVDDMIDQVNETGETGSSGRTRKLRVDTLTDSEKEGLKEQGYDIDGSEFVDIELEPEAKKTDDHEERRRRAAEALSSVSSAGVPISTKQEASEEPSHTSREVKALKEQLAAKTKALEAIPTHCTRCSWPTGEAVLVEPTKGDIKDFLRSVLGGEVYQKEYKLFGGEVAVTFRTRTGEEENAIRTVIRKMVREGEILQQLDMISEVRRCNFAFGLARYTTSTSTLVFDTGTGLEDGVDDAFKRVGLLNEVDIRVNKLPSQLIAVLMRKFDEFSELVDHLTAKVNDVGFWTGTES